MKLREAFIANSSSSSFVLFVSKEVYNIVLETLTDLQKKVVKLYSSEQPKKFMNRDIIAYSYYINDRSERYAIESAIEEYKEEMDHDDRVVNEAIKALSDSEEEDLIDKLSDFAFNDFEDMLRVKAEEIGEGVLIDSQSL